MVYYSVKIPHKLFWPLEVITLTVTLVGTVLKYLDLPGADEVLMIGLSSLSGVYFLRGFQGTLADDPESEKETNRNTSFTTHLVGIVIPRVAWIGCSVTLIGILFSILHLNGGAEQTIIGLAVLAVAILVSGYSIATDTEYASSSMRLLYRAVPICFLGVYVYMNFPTG